MNFIDTAISWLQANWGMTVFGGMSLGTIVTNAVLFGKQWAANKVQGTKYEALFNGALKTTEDAIALYKGEKAKNANLSAQTVFMQQAQGVFMDILVKMALASKLDSNDKVSIVASVERLRLMAPAVIVEEAKATAEVVADNVKQELTANPTQTVFNVAETAASLLDKYTVKKEG